MKIRIVDDLHPEDLAMLQALYSRSPESVDVHLEKVQAAGSGRFMEKFYVGFNHKSIADCGTTAIFIEGVSLLAAKAVQDWPLYSGQETSTRYINMEAQPVIDPVGGQAVIGRWMDFYRSSRGRIAAEVARRHPRRDGEDAVRYEAAVKARVFDIARGFLPAGITTQLSWSTNLRQAADHLALLKHHPAVEIRALAMGIDVCLHKAYPSSGFVTGMPAVSAVVETSEAKDAREAWERDVAENHTYNSGTYAKSFHNGLAEPYLYEHYGRLLKSRPRGAVLPHFLTDMGRLHFAFDLDFGSFRDLQRHRNGVCRMPLLTTDVGFEPWYVEQLDAASRDEALMLIETQTKAIKELTSDTVARQYYTALGFKVPCRVMYALPAAVYVMELRSSKTVHPTLRKVVHDRMIKPFREELPGIPLHVDEDPDDWTLRRGQQTIAEKEKS